MMVVRHDESGVGCEGTVHKFVVIRVFPDKSESELRVDEFNIVAVNQCVNNMFGYRWRRLLSYYLFIFSQNVVRHTQSVFPFVQSAPYDKKIAS